MASNPAPNLVLPANYYVQLAHACEDLQAEQSKGSDVFVRAKRCCFCARIIKLGAGSTDYSLQQHMLSRECQKFQTKFAGSNCDLPFILSNLNLPSLEPAIQALHTESLPSIEARYCTDYTPSTGEHFMACPGALVDYGISMFSHYPWHLHDLAILDYQFSYIDPGGRFFRVCSEQCSRKSPGRGAACKPCNQIVLGRRFQDLVRRASLDPSTVPSTKLQFWTYTQLCELVKEKTSQLDGLRLKVLASYRRIQSLCGRMDDHKRLMHSIAQSDNVSVGRIVQTALKNGAGIKTIIDRIVKAQEGLFSPQNYSQKAFDLIALVLKIGGPRLAFAVSKALHLPSISTVRNYLDLPQLLPSIAFPTRNEILKNIESFFASNIPKSSPRPKAGVSLMIDEVAIESRPRYHLILDAVIGICREHAKKDALQNLSTQSDSLNALLDTQALLDSGGCHRATEATMAAIARFGQSDYNPTVILASGTCKTEKAGDQTRWIDLLLKCWKESPHGEAVHGDIWSVCTDGDSKRRRALFQLCMTSTLPESSELFCLIGHLPLLNLCCGPTQITHDGDYKHEEKRLASALRSRSGVLINGVQITPQMLAKCLRALDDLSDARILSLFDGTDPQNVPKANTLLICLYRASQLPAFVSRVENKPIVLLGELVGSFARPFTDPTMTLDEQIASLVKCAHILFALYRIEGAKFLPGQLFYDIQASIKNAIFCVAKMQLVDPTLPFYLLQTGTDRLEARFGTYRTTSSDRNGDLKQMCDRAAGAQHIDEIFSAHPSWNRAPYRLSVDGRSGVDHTNPSSWVGDVVVGNVDLYSVWLRGQAQAATVLTQAGVPFQFDLAILSAESPSIDLMRPSGTYPGIQIDDTDPDFQPILLSDLAADLNIPEIDLVGDSCNSSGSDSGTLLDAIDDGLDTEQLLPAHSKEALPGRLKKGWLLVDGTWVHLESAIRYLLGAGGGAKSTDRLRRVCGFTRYLHSDVANASPILGDYFHVSDLIATFLRVEEQIVLAVVRITHIAANNGRSLESISEKEFQLPGFTLSGQVLQLEDDSGTWYWTQKYDSVADSTTSAYRKRLIGFDFDARLCRPVNPPLTERNGEHVWAFDHAQMKSLMDELWGICAGISPEDTIPVCKPSATFPYQTTNRDTTLCHPAATETVKLAIRPTQGACFHCSEVFTIKSKMRVHVGQHLLARQLRSGSTSTSHLVESALCGFCGRPDACDTSVERQHKATKAVKVVSNCPYRDDFSYSATCRSSKTNPCTNRPVQCPLCPPDAKYIWSYSLRGHLQSSHSSQALLGSINEELKRYEPSDDEYMFMQVDRETGKIQVTKTGKRKRGAEPFDSGVMQPSSHKLKH